MIRRVFLHIAAAACLPVLLARKMYGQARISRAVRRANRMSEMTGYRYIVLRCGSRIVVMPKRCIKSMLIFRGKYFARDVTIRDIERRAIYI